MSIETLLKAYKHPLLCAALAALFLDPANPDFRPIPLTAEGAIIGKVLQVVRDYA